ncbi:hypothetical protein ACFFTK_01190 [Pseudonocardia petroleophila]
MGVAIDRGDGQMVDTLLDAGLTVVVIAGTGEARPAVHTPGSHR